LGDPGGLEQQHRGRRGLEHEVERTVLVDRDHRRHDLAAIVLRRRVVGLAELHDVQAVRTQRLPDRGRVRGTRLQCELHGGRELLTSLGGHDPFLWIPPALGAGQILATWLNDSSTGVSRPKIDTSTLSFCASTFTSLIVAGNVANGPSMTVTDSPTSKSTSIVGFAPPTPPTCLPAPTGTFGCATRGARNF